MSGSPPQPAPPAAPPRRLPTGVVEFLFHQGLRLSGLVVVLLAVLLVLLLVFQAWPVLHTLGLSVVTSGDWKPNPANLENPEDHGRLGGLAFVYGSAVTSLLAMLLAVPLGVGAAAFLSEVASGWLRRTGAFLVELLAGIPSVVYGFWGITFLAPAVQRLFDWAGGPNLGGRSLLSAGLILALMIVPYITAVAFDVCQAVPRAQREAALALGATRWQTIWNIVLPYARPGIIGGCFLALGRALGETMAVAMLIGNVTEIQFLPFGQGSTIPSVLAQELPAPNTPMHRAALIELALVLLGLTLLLNILARLLIWRVGVGRRLGLWARWVGWHVLLPRPPDHPHDWLAQASTPATVRRAARRDRLMAWLLGLCLLAICVPLVLILGYITYRGAAGLDWRFFMTLPHKGGGLANGLAGSAILVGLATLLALPVGLLAAIYLTEFGRSRLARVVRSVGDLLGGVPSIVVGTFVYALVRFLIQLGVVGPRFQFSGWAGAVALALLMLPLVMRASEEALKLVPQQLRNSSYALGAERWQTVLLVVVPAALPAILTGVFLAMARIAGETAPLLLTIFGTDNWGVWPGREMAALPLSIYNDSRSGSPALEDRAWAAALVLVGFVVLLNVGIRLLARKRVVLASRSA